MFFVAIFCVFLVPVGSIFLTSINQPEIEVSLGLFQPNVYDTLLTDVKHEDLVAISREVFGFELNSKTDETPEYPVKGILYGEYNRVIFPIVLQHKKKKTKTLMIYDSACPFVYLDAHAYNGLGLDVILQSMNIQVHAATIATHLSVNHFNDVNVMGQTFIAYGKLSVSINGKSKKAYLMHDTSTSKDDEF